MHDNPEIHVSSAKQLMELNKQREKEALRTKAAEDKAAKISADLINLQKESNESARKALEEAKHRTEQITGMHTSKGTDVVDIKPNFFGLGINFNEIWRRFKKWISK